MANITRPADKKPLVKSDNPDRDGRLKLEWESFFTLLLSAVNAVSQNNLVSPKAYTVATVPSAVDNAGRMIYVTDEGTGATVAYSNGTNWLRVHDAGIIS